MSFDAKRLRADFPILSRTVHGKPLVYLDNAATTQKPRQVIDALTRYYTTSNANIHRGLHALSEEATEAYEAVRARTAAFIGAPGARNIVFTRNATEAINLVAHAWGRTALKPGDVILLSELEHHSNLVPWQLLAQATGASLAFLPIDAQGRLRLEELDRLLTPKVKLVAVTHMSNALGTLVPVERIIERAKRQGALTLIDGAQSVPHQPVDVQALGCDLLAFSAHKMLGPTGVGVLYAREGLLEAWAPFQGGGEMIADVRPESSTWNEVPWKYEAGTPNIADVIAFGEALAYLERLTMPAVRAHERELTAHALEQLRAIDGLTLYGPPSAEERGGVVSFNLDGLHPHDVGTVLDAEGIAVRAGHHCAKPLMRRMDLTATCRASFYVYNTPDEVGQLVKAIRAAQAFFRGSVKTR